MQGSHTAKDGGILRKTAKKDPASKSFPKQPTVLTSLPSV
jgi:hypothetical protein